MPQLAPLSQYLSTRVTSTITGRHGIRSSFISKDDFIYLFHYLPWDEATINDLIGHGWKRYHRKTPGASATVTPPLLTTFTLPWPGSR